MGRKTGRSRSQLGRAVKHARRPKVVSDAEAVRRAVCGTLNREVKVEIEKRPAGCRAITVVANGRRSPPIVVEEWEMAAMRQVPLVPAHLRGHFLRNYAVLTGQRAPASSARAEAAGER